MSEIKSIKCTNCAAPLNLLGGGRVESITCSYCKSVLDLNDNYKVVTNFKMVKERHQLPFDVGMRGEINTIEYTIIGRVTYAHVEYPHEEWTDFLLFSPLYGYAYLTYEEGHLIYSKRNRTFPNLTWSQIIQKEELYIDERAYIPFDEYEAKVVYVEGELTWIAKRNDKTSFIDLIAPPYGLSVEKNQNEIEHYQSQYLDASATYEAFGVEKKEKASTFHPLKPFDHPFLKSLSHIAFIVLFIIALLFVGVYYDGLGKAIKTLSTDNQTVKEVNFSVNSSKYLVALELQSPKAKELDNFNLKIYKNSKLLFSLTPYTAYLFDEKDGHLKKRLQPWEKKATKVLILLNLEASKMYQLRVEPIDMNVKSKLHITLKEQYSALNYTVWFFLFTLFLWLLYKFIAWLYKLKMNNERGIHLDEEDSDDDSINHFIMQIVYLVIIILLATLSDD